MKPEQIAALVDHFVSSELEAGEQERLERTVSDLEREAIGMVLAEQLEETFYQLQANNHAKVAPIADDLLAQFSITLPKDSPHYRRLSRELLKANQHVFKVEMDRWEGKCWNNGH
jgi:hypothetical protein